MSINLYPFSADLSGNSRRGNDKNRLGSGAFEGFGALGNRAAGGIDVIDQNYPFSRNSIFVCDGKRPPHVLRPLRGGKVDLRLGPTDTAQIMAQKRQPPLFRQNPPEKHRLVVAAPTQSFFMERNRNDEVGRYVCGKTGQMPGGQKTERSTEVNLVSILETMNEILHRPAENKGGTGRRIGRGMGQAGAAQVIDAVLGCKRNTAHEAQGRIQRNEFLTTAGAEVNVAGVGNKRLADVTEGRKEYIDQGAEKQPYSPMSSFTTSTLTSVRRGLRSMMVVMRQIRSGELQSEQKPVLEQGVL